MKNILLVNASKRRNGNSYALTGRFAEQLEGKAEVTIFNIGEKDVRACLACDGCKRQHTPNCIQKDDFTALISEIDGCDAMLILAPVHWDQFPAQLKAFLDRTYSFMDFTQPDFQWREEKTRKWQDISSLDSVLWMFTQIWLKQILRALLQQDSVIIKHMLQATQMSLEALWISLKN